MWNICILYIKYHIIYVVVYIVVYIYLYIIYINLKNQNLYPAIKRHSFQNGLPLGFSKSSSMLTLKIMSFNGFYVNFGCHKEMSIKTYIHHKMTSFSK